jgi:hypothetical protein
VEKTKGAPPPREGGSRAGFPSGQNNFIALMGNKVAHEGNFVVSFTGPEEKTKENKIKKKKNL